MSESVRAWLYRAALLLIPVLVVLGWVTDEAAAAITAAVIGLLGAGLATVNTKT